MKIATDTEPGDVLLLDTSTAIPLIIDVHDAHDATYRAVRGHTLGLAGHAWFETYSVLTRLSTGLRLSPVVAHGLLAQDFPATVFLSGDAMVNLIEELARQAIAGGAVYDALVATAAREHGLPLVSRDRRARPVYEALGVQVRFLD
jgi:predicted nucleic acid-binding protein